MGWGVVVIGPTTSEYGSIITQMESKGIYACLDPTIRFHGELFMFGDISLKNLLEVAINVPKIE